MRERGEAEVAVGDLPSSPNFWGCLNFPFPNTLSELRGSGEGHGGSSTLDHAKRTFIGVSELTFSPLLRILVEGHKGLDIRNLLIFTLAFAI